MSELIKESKCLHGSEICDCATIMTIGNEA